MAKVGDNIVTTGLSGKQGTSIVFPNHDRTYEVKASEKGINE